MKIRCYVPDGKIKMLTLDVERVELVLAAGNIQIDPCQRTTEAFRMRATEGILLVEPRVANEVVLVAAPTLYNLAPLYPPKPTVTWPFPGMPMNMEVKKGMGKTRILMDESTPFTRKQVKKVLNKKRRKT